MDKHRKQLQKQYASFEQFKQQYVVPQAYIDDILKAAEKEKIKPKDDAELQATLPMLRMQLKALVARDLWSMNEYFAIMNEQSDVVGRALQLLTKK
jgi:carboxyl-terminal processing protease